MIQIVLHFQHLLSSYTTTAEHINPLCLIMTPKLHGEVEMKLSIGVTKCYLHT